MKKIRLSPSYSIYIPVGLAAYFLLLKPSKAEPVPGVVAPTNPTDYIKTYLPFAKQTESTYGIPALFTIAQAGLESGWGTSGYAIHGKNHFGIHADSSWNGPTYKGLRAYNTAESSYYDHAKFLKDNSRYADAFNYTDPVDFAKAVADAGYSTNAEYFPHLKSVIDSVKTITGL